MKDASAISGAVLLNELVLETKPAEEIREILRARAWGSPGEHLPGTLKESFQDVRWTVEGSVSTVSALGV